ncbi:hypothetical protein GPJ56_010274 [Histomonas meleagridis]|uniref:uncharacterized protein n=1 Tax=Histomonas meleagridis TaxID=135588 RepID=UPI0035596A81|nr:hypothetical protein GPJ56_010274 [Histomonas meleagridis]KAH0797143.1 hypothetical protein GO595_011036 [Histomonas meleagridis]
MEELRDTFKIFLTCDSVRKDDFLQELIKADRKTLLSIIYLPEDSEERLRVYDLLVKIKPDGADLLSHVFEECQNDSDPLLQLAAIQFVEDNNLDKVETFIDLFNKSADNPLTLPSIAQTVSSMILRSEDPLKYSETIETIIEKASTTIPDLLGSLPKLTSYDPFAQMMLNSDTFKLWIIDFPYNVELRTFNLHMRNLLTPHCKDPSSLFLSETNILNSMIHPSPALRCAVFEHISVMAPFFKQQMLSFNRFQERLFDPSMDSTKEEMFSRRKAIHSLGLDQKTDGSDAGPIQRQQVEDLGPDLMII